MNTVYFGGVEFALYNSGNPIELGPTVEPKLFGLLDKGEPGEYEIRFEAKSRDSRVRVEITTCDKAHTAYELNLYTPSGAHVIPRGCQKAQIQISHALLIKGENVETARGSFTIDASVECFGDGNDESFLSQGSPRLSRDTGRKILPKTLYRDPV